MNVSASKHSAEEVTCEMTRMDGTASGSGSVVAYLGNWTNRFMGVHLRTLSAVARNIRLAYVSAVYIAKV